ncbi:MAG: CBS domain-containing protein [Rubrivivax sp.]|nr:CBS domain-containing protein [Rubrivivax sp.]
MTTAVVTVGPDTPVTEIAQRLVERRISAVPVVDDDGRPLGIVSEGDLMRRPEIEGQRHPSWWLALVADPVDKAIEYLKAHGGQAHEVMTRTLVSVDEDASLEQIAALLEKHGIKRVPVLRDGKLVGIVSRADLLRGVAVRQGAPQLSADVAGLRERVAAEISATGVRGEFVNVIVSGGVVSLWGATFSDEEREAAGLAASRAAGIRRVENNLGVFTPSTRTMLWE